jgi:uncharacterized protein YggE
MKSAIAATMAVAAGLLIANMLGVASAEAPSTSPIRTVGVEGVATAHIAQGANKAEATAIYREGMASAIADGLSKAEFLASKTGATLGSVQSIAEGGGSIDCTGVGAESDEYAQYEGEQPDFGFSSESVGVAVPAEAAATPVIHKPAAKHRKKKHTAKAASAANCTLSTQVSLVYVLD